MGSKINPSRLVIIFLICLSIAFIGTTSWLLVERSDDDVDKLADFESENDFVKLKVSRDGVLELTNNLMLGNSAVVAQLGSHLSDEDRDHARMCTEKDYCVEYPNSKVTLSVRDECYDISWTVKDNSTPTDCFENGKTYWYGGAEVYYQQWPLGSLKEHPYLMQTYVSHDMVFDKGSYGSVVERLWITSTGAILKPSETDPLWVETTDKHICLKSQYQDSEYRWNDEKVKSNTLSYTLCQQPNVVEANRYAVSKWYQYPSTTPNMDLFKKPIWTTWARFKVNIDQQTIIDFAKDILANDYPISQLEIDDKWTTEHGDLTPNPEKFPDPKQMTDDLHDMGIKVTIWTHPFLNIESDTLQKTLPSITFTDYNNTSDEYLYYVKAGNPYNKQPGMIKWWNGYGCHLGKILQGVRLMSSFSSSKK